MKKTLLLFLTTSLLLPSFVSAQTATSSSANFCGELNTILKAIDTNTITLQIKQLQKNNSIASSSVLIGNIAAKRTEVETAKVVLLNELQNRVKTAEQQKTLEKFALTARDATIKKNAELDRLLTNNQANIASTLALRDIEIAKATSTLKTAIDAAKAKAQADCEAGVAPIVIRSTLRSTVEKALESFRVSVSSIQKNRAISDTSLSAKKAEVKRIMQTYEKELSQAQKELKSSLRQASTTSTSTR